MSVDYANRGAKFSSDYLTKQELRSALLTLPAKDMNWRRLEMTSFGPEVIPLERADALAIYNFEMGLCSRTRYGLEETSFSAIERVDIDDAPRRCWQG
jgi:hypothetical protein